MSLAKQIGYAVLATLVLVAFGFGSYFASKTLFPNPTASTGSTSNNSSTGEKNFPTVEDSKRLAPANINTLIQGETVLMSFETAGDVSATLYVTSDKSEKIEQSMKDYTNGVLVKGRFFVVDADNAPVKTHVVKFPKTVLSTTNDAYYFILLKYKGSWLPYGETMDYPKGPSEPYYMKL